jgi:hypothetical protein
MISKEERKMREKRNIYDEKWDKYRHIKIHSAISKYLRECRNLNIACERVIVCYVNMFDAWMWKKKKKKAFDRLMKKFDWSRDEYIEILKFCLSN